jgi:DNA-binding SARP family transcriptional activator/tetratricopeptide (TPR) repeat protein
MEFRILGPLEVLDEGHAVTLGGSKQRALLALLLLHANETLSTDRLIDELWGERPPANAAKTVQMQISRLRKALAGGADDGSAGVVVTRERGYELRLDPEGLDAHRFERLLDEGRSELAADHPERAAATLEAALAMWRGAPLADLAYEPFAQREIARLEELRVGVLEQLIEARLALGGHAEVISQLETLIAEHPYRERPRAQLMLALYRCDRQADALQAYQDARRQLVEELGIEPGERLRQLERAILAQDPALAAPRGRDDGDAAPPGTAPAELPTGVVTFLLTDIEGSSGLWEADPEAMAVALELHDELIARSVEAHAGRLLKQKGEGDATVSAFRRSSDAVAAAVEVQEALAAAAWPGGLELRARIALHTGEAHERAGDYFGPALNRAARLRALARGGAIVVSQATAEIVHDRLPRGVELVELGRHQLRGLSRPENVFGLRPVAARAPAPAAVAVEPAAPEAAAETGRGALVGRERELAELVGGLDDAFAGRGRLFLLGGEPGIGKSRLAEELIAHAGARGARVLVGRCWEAGGAPAYWPWVQSLRPYLRDSDAESLRSQLGEGAADVARVLPELRDLLDDLPPAPPLESEGARFRLFDSLTAFLKRAAAAQPLVLVLDDLHAADEPSLVLLQFVARELGEGRLLIVGAYRNVDPSLTDPLRTTLTELAREPVTRTLALGGLGESDVACFMELAAPGTSAAELAPAVHSETEGNPLFVGEIVRLLAAERRLDQPAAAPLAIPQSVREVIGRRLRHLSAECNRLLTLASVLGREFDLDALASVSGLERGALLELLDEAIEARVVSDVPGLVGRVRFAHALIRDAAYHALARSRRVQLHRRVGEALEVLYSSDLDPHLAELAHHFFQSAAGGDGQKAVDYARRAGARAVVLFAYEEALRLFEMALEALGPYAAATAELRCELLLALADAQGRAGDDAGAKSTYSRTVDLARSAGLHEMLARGAAGYGGRFLWTHELMDERLVPLLEEGLSALGESDSVLRVQLLSRLAAALRHRPNREPRERIGEEAIQTARRIGDSATLAHALAGVEAALHAPHTAQRRLAEGHEIVSLAARTGDRERLFDGHEHSFWAAWELGDPERRAVELASMTRVAGKLRQPAQNWALATAQATLALAQGRFAEAPELIQRAATIGERVQPWVAKAAHKLQLFLLRRELVQLDGFEREIRDHAHEFPSPLLHRAVLAHIYARLERTAEAQALLHELTRRDLSDWHVDEEWLASICLLSETCAILEHTESAAPLYQLLLPWGSLNALGVPEFALDSISRPLGMLATLLARFEEAARHFEAALRMNERMAARPWLAHTEDAYARMLLRRNGQGDRERAEKLLSQAHATYHDLGIQGHATKAAAPAQT